MTRALVLVGGGSKGIIQAGMLKRIHELGLQIDSIYGTSSGSLNGALYSQGDIDLMVKLWMTIESKDVQKLSLCDMIKQKSIYSSSPLAATIAKYIDPNKLAIPTWATASNTQTNAANHIRIDKQATCHQTLLASISIPVYFPPIDDVMVDGGLLDNYNVGAAIQGGADEIIICHPSRPSALRTANLIGIAEWAYEAVMWSNYVHEMENCGLHAGQQDRFMGAEMEFCNKPVRVRVCIPDAPIDVPILDFSYKGLDRAAIIEQGYQIAKRLIG